MLLRVGYLSVESGLPICLVLYGPHVTIGLYQRVLPFDHIPITFLFLLFNIPCVWIVYSVLEGVPWMRILKNSQLPRGGFTSFRSNNNMYIIIHSYLFYMTSQYIWNQISCYLCSWNIRDCCFCFKILKQDRSYQRKFSKQYSKMASNVSSLYAVKNLLRVLKTFSVWIKWIVSIFKW